MGQGQFTSLSYTWSFNQQLQEGQIIFLSSLGENPARAIWFDSWHMRNDIMICEGMTQQEGTLSLRGSYPAPPGPDWGWRIEIDYHKEGLLLIYMLNITPEGRETLAVHAQYWKYSPGD
jgi:hypothetical protein